jgi:HD-GYP domain-containing protein (c-di-GMP phosphodiesterase class II)
MTNRGSEQTNIPPSPQRLALDFIRPGMSLARDVYDEDGTIMLSAGMVLTERLISRLEKRQILSVFIRNPRIELPEVSDSVKEATRSRARMMVEHAFNSIKKAERFSMSEEEQKIVHKVVEEATQDPLAVVQIAHINRNSRDIMAHSVNVSLLSAATALAMGVNNSDTLHELALAALLHDIGLLMIPQDLLARRESLKPEENLIYREHANWGFAILQESDSLPRSVALVAQQHHEHADGSGYPHQLTSSTLHPFSRIVAAVNAYETMCVSFAGSNGCKSHLAYESILAGAGSRFDLQVAKALLSRLPMYPPGSLVELTNGLVGVVISADSNLPHRPTLKILGDSSDSLFKEHYLLDLVELENQTLFVKEVLSDERAAAFISAK